MPTRRYDNPIGRRSRGDILFSEWAGYRGNHPPHFLPHVTILEADPMDYHETPNLPGEMMDEDPHQIMAEETDCTQCQRPLEPDEGPICEGCFDFLVGRGADNDARILHVRGRDHAHVPGRRRDWGVGGGMTKQKSPADPVG